MQTDYGERGHFASSYANIGYAFGGIMYLSVSDKRKYWNQRGNFYYDHFRLRFEISFMKTKLKHRGRYTEGTSENTIKYNAMRGISTILNYGFQIEYSISPISDNQFLEPYVSFGILRNSNKPQLNSTIGNINTDNSLIPTVYTNGVFLNKNTSFSPIISAGIRVNKNEKSKYLIDFRLQRFNSDIVEGLKPKLDANKFNDWLLCMSFGYILKLN